MAVVEYGRALYYPYIHLQNPLWLKTAALYYDKIFRIVPFDFNPHDTGEAEILNRELKLLEEIDPRNEAERLAPEFIDFAREYLANPRFNKRILAKVRNIFSKRKSLPEEMLSQFRGKEDFRIHPGKMAQDLGEALTELGLAKKAKDDYNNDFDLEPATGALYMVFLAKKMAEVRSLPVVTDDPIYQPLIHQPIDLKLQSGAIEEKMDKGFTLASFAIETVVPKHATSLTVGQVIRFRERHEGERVNFRNEVIKLAKDLEKVNHPKAIEDYLNDKRKVIEEGVKALEGSLKSVNIDCVRNLFALSVPAWVGASWIAPLIMATPIIVPGAVTLAASFAMVKWGIDRKKAKSASQYSYVLALKKNVEIRRFMNDLQAGKILI